MGRPVLIIAEPDAEGALTVSQNGLGWVVTSDDAEELAKTIRIATCDKDIKMKSAQAAAIAAQFSRTDAQEKYQSLTNALLEKHQ